MTDGSPSSPSRISCVGATVPGGVPLDAALLARWERRPWLCGTSTVEALIAEVRRLNAELESAVLYMNAGGKPPDALAGAVGGFGEARSGVEAGRSLSVEEAFAFLESVYMDDEYDAEERYGAALAVLRDELERQGAADTFTDAMEKLNALAVLGERARTQRLRAVAAEARADRYRVALQDAQGILLNGLPGVETESERIDAADKRITAALADTDQDGGREREGVGGE